MKQTAIKVLDETDLEFIEALRNLKVPRNVATLITYLANANEATSREDRSGNKLEAAGSEHRYACTTPK